jgi:GMP synthase (glutamine-hydrolysing)
MAIIIFQHSAANRPGRIGTALQEGAHRLDVRRLDLGDPVPCDFDNVSGVVSLGGPQDVGDDIGWMREETAFLKEAHERKLPVFGVCLGAQMIADALGGEVTRMAAAEVGFFDLKLTGAGHVDTVYSGVAWEHKVFCHHAYEVRTLPAGAALLASTEACKAQAFRVGMRTYAFQYHVEADEVIALGINRDAVDSPVHDVELRLQLKDWYQSFARMSDRVCENFASHVAPAAKAVGASGG